MYKIVVLLSGNGSNLQNIIDQVASGSIKAEISAVISNRPDAFGLKRAEKAGISNVSLDHTLFTDREAFDQSLIQIIDSYSPDLIVLAGFMRILSDDFVHHFTGRLINIHPSLLPKYKGLHTHKRAIENGDKKHGASVHFVSPELDSGEVILQGIVDVEENDTEESLQQRVHLIEHQIYPQTIQWLSDGSLEYQEGQLFFNKERLKEPFKVTLD